MFQLVRLLLGDYKKNEVFKVIFCGANLLTTLTVIFLARSRFKRVVYYLQFALVFILVVTTLLFLYGFIPKSNFDLLFMERR